MAISIWSGHRIDQFQWRKPFVLQCRTSFLLFMAKKSARLHRCDLWFQILPTFYERAITATTSLPSCAPSLSIRNTSEERSQADDNHRTNIYEEIPSSFDSHPCCACCSCTVAHYYEKQSGRPPSTPYYHMYEPSLPRLVCQTCLFQTLHRQQQCACHHFFVPIK